MSARYIVFLVCGFVAFSVAIVLFKRPDILPRIESCNPAGYSDDQYMAYCHEEKFGDYELYSFVHDTEPLQIAAAQDAQVLFLGNSRTQYAFSSDSIQRYFDDLSVSYFVFGFGLGSRNRVAEELVQRLNLTPEMVVINVDPFFVDLPNTRLDEIINNSDLVRWEYTLKKKLQQLQNWLCNDTETNRAGFMCSGESKTIFRSRATGKWDYRYYEPDRNIPVSLADVTALEENIKEALPIAEAFVKSLNIPRSCVLFTVTPRTATEMDFAAKLGDEMGIQAFLPYMDNLVTVDDSHLNAESAEIWTSALLDLGDAAIRDCLEKTQ